MVKEVKVEAVEYKIISRKVKSTDGKQEFDTFKVVDEENHNRLVDGVLCKSVDDKSKKQLIENGKSVVAGDIQIDRNGFEYPKAFIRSITSIKKA